MNILIKGMEMPKSCDECRIMVFEDTNCAPELYCGCPIVFKAHPQGVGHRPDYCPLAPVPPHGRCIDADALAEQTITEWLCGNPRVNVPWRAVSEAPTIIPAEEGE